MFNMPGHFEIMLIALVILLLFGAKRIPEMARGLGKGIREFKDGLKNVESDMKELDEKEDKKEKK